MRDLISEKSCLISGFILVSQVPDNLPPRIKKMVVAYTDALYL